MARHGHLEPPPARHGAREHGGAQQEAHRDVQYRAVLPHHVDCGEAVHGSGGLRVVQGEAGQPVVEGDVVLVAGHAPPVVGDDGVHSEAGHVTGDDVAHELLPPPNVGVILEL